MDSIRNLIVDDEQPARYSMVKVLDRQADHIVEADSGPTAAEMWQQQSAKLVFLAVSMRQIGGQAVPEQLSDLVDSTQLVESSEREAIESALEQKVGNVIPAARQEISHMGIRVECPNG